MTDTYINGDLCVSDHADVLAAKIDLARVELSLAESALGLRTAEAAVSKDFIPAADLLERVSRAEAKVKRLEREHGEELARCCRSCRSSDNCPVSLYPAGKWDGLFPVKG